MRCVCGAYIFFMTSISNIVKNCRTVFQSGFASLSVTHRFQYLNILTHLCHCHCGRQERLDTEFSSTICSKENPFHWIVPALLLKINWTYIWSFFLAPWTFYSTYLYSCFIKSVPPLDDNNSVVNFGVREWNISQLHSFSRLFFTFLCLLYFSTNGKIIC